MSTLVASESEGPLRRGVVMGPTSAILGRDLELGVVSGFLDRIESGPVALVIDGPAGIGKTTVWLAGVADAINRGYRVLTSRGAESEARLSYAALGDLLGDVPETSLSGMPTPLRLALDTAFLRAEVPGGSLDQRAVALAAGLVLRRLAADAPLMIAIDDLQWLDRPSIRVLSFVLRRLSDERVGVFVSVRQGSGSKGDPVDLDRAIARTTHLAVGPLPPEPLARILRDRTSRSLPHPVVIRLHRVSGGNPLFAIEMARAAASDGVHADPDGVWAVPEDLQQLLSARLAALALSARESMLAIAASSQPTWELVLEIAGSSERTLAALARAETTGVIERAGGRVRFSHPLLGSTVYLSAPPHARRAVHVRLAALTSDPEERARHLALGADGPNPEVAIALDEAARRARARGAPDAAADLAELACRMTGPADEADLRRRRLHAAEYRFDAGDAAGAIGLLRDTVAACPPGPERAEMLYRLASMSWMNLVHGVRSPCEQALAEAGDDPGLQGEIHHVLAWVSFYLGDLDEALAEAHKAADDVASVADPAARADAIAVLAFVQYLRGDTDHAALSEAIALQDVAMSGGSWTEGSVYTTPRSILGLALMWAGRLDEARDVLVKELAEYERRGMYTVRQEVLCYLAELECRAGRWPLAAQYADEAMDIVQESGQTATQSHVVLFNQAWPAAHLGEVDLARQHATSGLRFAQANDDLFNAAWSRAVLGFLDLSLSDFEAARQNLEPAVRYLERLHSAEPAIIPCVPDLVEALVGLGQFGEAERLVGRLEEQARALDRVWAHATAFRGRALIAAARGDLAEAQRAAEASVEVLEGFVQPFETARSTLVLGQIHRRTKRKRLAREYLERAHEAFTALGARLWADRARAELARIGGRPSTPFELTETERKIAALVARGHTNQEAADALFISPSTVQANLKRVYQKLDVRSRTELAARISRIEKS
jgi:DNA-binding CsgD family transcriptional regulator